MFINNGHYSVYLFCAGTVNLSLFNITKALIIIMIAYLFLVDNSVPLGFYVTIVLVTLGFIYNNSVNDYNSKDWRFKFHDVSYILCSEHAVYFQG